MSDPNNADLGSGTIILTPRLI
jgi:hypothetical protein